MTTEDKKMEDRFFFRQKKRKPEVLLSDVFKSMKASILLKQVEKRISYADRRRIRVFEQYKATKFQRIDYDSLIYMFMMTKPFTGLTKEGCEKMVFNLREIRKFRKKNKTRKEKIVGFFYPEQTKDGKSFPKLIYHIDPTSRWRIFPLSQIDGFFYPEQTKDGKSFPKFIYHTDPTSRGRIFPLSQQDYINFAKRIWEKEGYPKHNKRKIGGVRMGMPVTHRDRRYGYYNCILSRHLGVMQCKIDGKWELISRVYN